MGLKVNVSVTSATGIGGVYPFVVVCFDGDLSNELFKTPAVTAAPTCTWNATFPLDLTTQIKAHIAAGNPEPKYLTFFIFDTGAPGVPSLGSAGVLLNTVHESGIAQGDFQVVNGSGTLALVVSNVKHIQEGEQQAWYKTNTAKIAAGTGVAAVAAGLGGLALHKFNKKKKEKNATPETEPLQSGTRELVESDDDAAPKDKPTDRPWYDPGTSSSSEQGDQHEEDEHEEAEQEYQAYEGADDGAGYDG